jgi:hypothetical protein
MSSQPAGVTRALHNHLAMRVGEYQGLPSPSDGQWTVDSVDLNRHRIQPLARRGVIKCVERRSRQPHVWRTCGDAWERLVQIREDASLLPCGHRGFRTVDLDDDQPYTCTHDGCDRGYDRETVSRVFGDD